MSANADRFSITLDNGALRLPLHRFAHEAMGTIFGVSILGGSADYAQSAARTAFELVDRLEQLMSRFIEGSDVWRINHLSAGAWTPVDADTLNCLQLAQQISDRTHGAFDITIGRLLAYWREFNSTQNNEAEFTDAAVRTGMDLLTLDEQAHGVGVRADGVEIDLGGIGKGYAVDCMMDLLKEWDIENALAHGGQSTVHAAGVVPGSDGWPMILHHPEKPAEVWTKIHLSHQALSGSGVQIQGEHIIDPRTCEPARTKVRAYALSDSAAAADALSTAFMVMSLDEIKTYCQQHTQTTALIALIENDQYHLQQIDHPCS